MNFRNILECKFFNSLGRILKVKATKGIPSKMDAPIWATHLGKTNEGAYHWLSNNSVVEKNNKDNYFPDSKKTKFSGFVGEKDNGSVISIDILEK